MLGGADTRSQAASTTPAFTAGQQHAHTWLAAMRAALSASMSDTTATTGVTASFLVLLCLRGRLAAAAPSCSCCCCCGWSGSAWQSGLSVVSGNTSLTVAGLVVR